MIAMLKELDRLRQAATLSSDQVHQLVLEIGALQRKAGPAIVLDDRHVLCPACAQVRGCVHLAAEIQQLRDKVALRDAELLCACGRIKSPGRCGVCDRDE